MSVNRWVPLLIAFLLLGLLLISPILVALPLTLLALLGFANWWRRHALDHVHYRRRFYYTRAFPGEKFPVRVEIDNNKLLPLSWLRVRDPWPKAIGPEDEQVLAPSYDPQEGLLTHVFSLRWFQRAHRDYELIFRKRGAYSVGPARLSSGDLFGIYEKTQNVGPAENITVFPSLLPLHEVELPSENPFGDHRSRRRLFEDPSRPMGVREYHPEDGFRRVHWPATARTGQLQVKIYQPTTAQVVVLCLNVSTYPHYWEGVYPELLEHLLSTAASLVYQGIEYGYRVGIISNGALTNSDLPFRIPPGRSPQQLTHLLTALGGVSPIVVAPFSQFLLREVPRVPYGAMLLVLTAVSDPELVETLMRLKKHERSITMILLAKESPQSIPGVRSIHLPFKEEV